MSLTEIPQDVLLELVKEFDVADLLRFLSVCHSICELQLQRSLWLHALVRIRDLQMQPLPLSNAEPLDTLSLEQLQHAARQANRLMRNFKSDSPSPVRIQTLSTGHTHLSCIQGTHLVVTYSLGTVNCWDIITSHRVAHLEIPDLQIVSDKPCLEIKGRALFGACIGTQHFAAICVEYHDRIQISISHVISPPTSSFLRRAGFFINSRFMGCCTSSSTVYWSMREDSEVETGAMTLSDPADSPPGRCLLFGENIYSFHQGVRVAEGILQSRAFSPAGLDEGLAPNRESKSLTLPVPYPLTQEHTLGNVRNILYHPTEIQVPDYGIFAVASTVFEWAQQSRSSMVHFWPGNTVGGNLDVGPACFYHDTGGVLGRTAVGRSGTYVLTLIHEGDVFNGNSQYSQRYLGLVHFSSTPTPHTTFRKLDIGDAPSLRSIRQIALDDSIGLVLLLDDAGILTAISYV
ncbi:hypothetical protein B0H16DRAFT_1522863 [Mycena metata]|uniref:F-box domain-containing protein n=1 Tax=Mycena metata TaxID=1033252 RepID=A0AAD7JMJ4_9AGAR|nr:hypothetical protein B0H16DRAFT_1522863 [Mycena metata]